MIVTAPDWTGPFEEELISMLEAEYRQANFLIKCAKEAEAGPADGELIDAHSSAVKLAARIKKAMYKPKEPGVTSVREPESNASSVSFRENHVHRPKFSELKPGDKLHVKCPKDTGIWVEETVTAVEHGEDGYKGSGWWYTRVYTDRSQRSCGDDEALEGKHWPILIKRDTGQYVDTTEASYSKELVVFTGEK